MTGPDAGLAYTYATVTGLSFAITAFVAGMEAELSSLDAVFTQLLRNDWDGLAAQAFRAKSEAWHRAADEIAERVRVLAREVGNASTDMADTDDVVTARLA